MKRTLFFAVMLFLIGESFLAAQIDRQTRTWNNATDAFAQFEQEIAAQHARNFLAFPNAKLVKAESVNSPDWLTDGRAGTLGDQGRVEIHGTPSVLLYYLGAPRKIAEIRICTGNIDQRGNQDFEIRLANNSAKPGEMPQFANDATLTSGETVLGGNGGGVMTTFTEKSGKPLFDEPFDWIEVKMWKTYPNGTAGSPAKEGNKSDSWGSAVEIQVLGNMDDPASFASEEERNAFQEQQVRQKQEKEFARVGRDTRYALKQFAKSCQSLRLAIEDLSKRFPDQYNGQDYLKRLSEFEKQYEQQKLGLLSLDWAKRFAAFRKEVLLANPLLNFDELLFRRAQNSGLEANWISNCSRGKGDYGNALVTVPPRHANGEYRTVLEGPQGSFVGDIALHWDADKMLVTALGEDKTWQVFEVNLDGTGLRQVTPSIGTDIDNAEGCYVPDGSVLFISTASMMGVPCIDGSSQVGNIYRIEEDGQTVRQLTFEQDQDWCPVVLPNGRIMYLRWEYTDTAHYFTRILFSMNPDGTNQVEHYGSNSFWPNSLFYAKPIPGHSTKFVGIVTGHHGVPRMGELVIFDPAIARKEAEGVVQRIPGYGEKVEPIIADTLVDGSWPKFLFPYPLDENYYLVSCQMTPDAPWGLYLVDVFDNMLLLREEPGYYLLEPTPIVKRPAPPIIPNRIDPDQNEATVFLTDIYMGDGLKDVPRGTVKKLRVFAYSFGYRGIGGHAYFGMESCWDARRILGEVPVYEDGSAMFTIPANVPIAIQPLDENGRALQIMRSWFVGMPGETLSCVGCHEPQNTVTPAKSTIARTKLPSRIESFAGPERPVSYEGEVQPVLDQYCVGCHNGKDGHENIPNFADTKRGPMSFSKSYHALSRHVRRPGPESDVYMLRPLEYHASTSELFQKLERGHHGVEVDPESMKKLYLWADLNIPYFGTWTEVAQANRGRKNHLADVNKRYMELKEQYAGVKLDYEADANYSKKNKTKVDFVKPKELPKPDYSAPAIANWPFDAEKAKKMQAESGKAVTQVVKLGDQSEFTLARIPAGQFIMGDVKGNRDELPRLPVQIEKPFWIMTEEVSNALYKLYDSQHDSRYIDQQHKDHTTAGYPANKPEQPVIRISWNEANDFCRWLSEKTGKKFRLPSEAEWEWAARAGTETPMWYAEGQIGDDFGPYENLSDDSTRLFVVSGINPQPVAHADWQAFIPRADGINDGQMIAEKRGAYKPNPWGLYDMLGGVSEWTSSDYKPYPFKSGELGSTAPKVARGGSWTDRPEYSRAGIRRYYEPWQKVHNVGFRVIMEE
ncbi:MAG: SUMF1/EgtB/PvdO family nonheme iron enzyme [Thermoguttaceae bacterium]